jgi:hypothetical protein
MRAYFDGCVHRARIELVEVVAKPAPLFPLSVSGIG